jgi:hypothetical protein
MNCDRNTERDGPRSKTLGEGDGERVAEGYNPGQVVVKTPEETGCDDPQCAY